MQAETARAAGAAAIQDGQDEIPEGYAENPDGNQRDGSHGHCAMKNKAKRKIK
jgi:hypothetical protein